LTIGPQLIDFGGDWVAVALARLVHFADNTQPAQPTDPADWNGKGAAGRSKMEIA